MADPHQNANAARALSQNRLSEPRLTVWHEYLALVNQVTCQVGGLNLSGLELLGVDGERVLVQDYQVGILAGLQAAEVLLVACRIGATQGVVAQGCSRIDALAGKPAALGPVAARVLARDGRVEHVHAGNGCDGAIGAEGLADAALLIGCERPHDAAALQAQIALGAARVECNVTGLARGNDVKLA